MAVRHLEVLGWPCVDGYPITCTLAKASLGFPRKTNAKLPHNLLSGTFTSHDLIDGLAVDLLTS